MIMPKANNNQKVGETNKLETALEKVATNIANESVKSAIILIGSALENALKTKVKDNDGAIRELNSREVLIVLTNTLGEYVKNMEKKGAN